MQGPVLIASNHPNSFLDAVIIDIMFETEIWSLARGDVFTGSQIKKLLHAVRILPIYRTSEGVENLSSNYSTFDACVEIFRNNGAVQIFSEGLCINEWHLRPLKKGTARLAFKAWDQQIPLKVIPLALNYNSFKLSGKNIFLNLGEPIEATAIDMSLSEGQRFQQFNAKLSAQLRQLTFEIDKNDKEKQCQLLTIPQSTFKKVLLFIPSIIGWLIHAPYYLPLKWFTKSSYQNSGHYDSVLTSLLVFTYWIYVLALTVAAYMVSRNHISWVLLILLPFFAWSHVQLKRQIDP